MMSSTKFIFAFVLGSAAGSAITWKIVKTKYEQIAQEEIDSVKEVFARRLDEYNDGNAPVEDEPELTEEEIEKAEYVTIIDNYNNVSNQNEEKGGSATMNVGSAPYVITPEEFDELDEYDTSSLTYYDDGVLTDEYDEIVENIDDIVGIDSLQHFGEYEDDSVFVRNDRLKCDYEILLDHRRYRDLNPVDDE